MAVTVLPSPGWALVMPSLQSILSRATPPDQQGLLQGGIASVNTGTAIIGPPLATTVFAYFIGPEAPMLLPGASFYLGAVLILASNYVLTELFFTT